MMGVRMEETGFCLKRPGSPDCMWDGEACGIRACDAGMRKVFFCDHCGEDVDDSDDLAPVLHEWVCSECRRIEEEEQFLQAERDYGRWRTEHLRQIASAGLAERGKVL